MGCFWSYLAFSQEVLQFSLGRSIWVSLPIWYSVLRMASFYNAHVALDMLSIYCDSCYMCIVLDYHYGLYLGRSGHMSLVQVLCIFKVSMGSLVNVTKSYLLILSMYFKKLTIFVFEDEWYLYWARWCRWCVWFLIIRYGDIYYVQFEGHANWFVR